MKVILGKKHSNQIRYKDLSLHKTYYVMGIQDCEYFWIVNDEGRAYLYEMSIFEVIDTSIPDDWEIDWIDGEIYGIYPKELNRTSFFEDYYEGNIKDRERASMQLERYMMKIMQSGE